MKKIDVQVNSKGGEPMLWGFPLEMWNSVIVWSLVIACITGAVAAVSGFVAGFIGWKVSVVSQQEAEEQVSSLRLSLERAREESAKATMGAAEANKRVTDANRKLEEARQDTAKHELELIEQRKLLADSAKRVAEAEAKAAEAKLNLEIFKAPRSVSSEQGVILSKAVSSYSGEKILIEHYAGSEEVEHFSHQLAAAFRKAGVVTEVRPIMTFGGSLDGISARIGSERQPLAEVIGLALLESKLNSGPLRVTISKSKDPKEFVLIIGHKETSR